VPALRRGHRRWAGCESPRISRSIGDNLSRPEGRGVGQGMLVGKDQWG
jgi:hypothetical protein